MLNPLLHAVDEAGLHAWVSERVMQLEGFHDQVMIDMVCRRVLSAELDRADLEAHLRILMDSR